MFKQEVRYIGQPISNLNHSGFKRIIVLAPHFVDYLLTLDSIPIGVVSEDDNGTTLDDCVIPAQQKVISVGTSKLPQLDIIKELKPDLILGEAKKHIHLFKALDNLAPTILIKDLSVDWKKILLFLSHILNKEQIARQKLDELDEQINMNKPHFKTFFANKTVLLANVWKKEGLQVHNFDSHLGKILYQQIGLRKPSPLHIEDKYIGYKYMFPHKLDSIASINPDILFLFNTVGVKQEEIFKEIEKSSLWNDLSCVKNDQVYRFGSLKDGNEGRCVRHYTKILNEISKHVMGVN
ncbi:ABC transporter substrate-binding protein [Desulfuribacillus alkaliarsenatis]|uniref:Fe/B12 periplasmic-binding domain-containing protein n=1 Tax=Desulfuribacillus alkaliarsenatis TaxID=766136 RepID=A0A1E5G4N1_9FIRM|nr:ABC transporter substrate-binding protein [Desulfuribacillus alkaliarsenatis]OEF98123.1 hypothetical protein BHF68_00065 [Desulfuribacillus alkaliarsenatis]